MHLSFYTSFRTQQQRDPLKYKLDPVAPLLKTFSRSYPFCLEWSLDILPWPSRLCELTLCPPLRLDIPLFLLIWLSFNHTGVFVLSLDHPRHLDWGFVHQLFHLENTHPPCVDMLSRVLFQVPAHMSSPEKRLPWLAHLVAPSPKSFSVPLAYFIFLRAFTTYLCVCHFAFTSRWDLVHFYSHGA